MDAWIPCLEVATHFVVANRVYLLLVVNQVGRYLKPLACGKNFRKMAQPLLCHPFETNYVYTAFDGIILLIHLIV